MKTGKVTANPLHDEVCELLPWYVNGTLRDSERTLVEEHVHSCIVCRRELAIERRTLDAFRNESPLDQSAHAGFERLHARIVGTTRPRQPCAIPSSGFIGQWILNLSRYVSGPNVRAALIAVPVAVAVIAFGLANFAPNEAGITGNHGAVHTVQDSGSYQTLSSSDDGAADRDDIHVIFAQNTGTETIRELLESLRAEVIVGPNTAGAYTVRLLGVANEAQRQATIMQLRRQNEVLFAEAAQPMAVPPPSQE